MNLALVFAGAVGLLAAAVHGLAGELLVMRRLGAERLAPSPFGGPPMTRAMIHVSWHLVTIAFATCGATLVAAGAFVDGDAAQALGIAGAAGFSGFAGVVLGLGVPGQSLRKLFVHPAPAILTAAAILAWVGAL